MNTLIMTEQPPRPALPGGDASRVTGYTERSLEFADRVKRQ